MRVTPSILAVTISVVSILLGPVAFSQTATLRYDGTYHRIGADKTAQHLRFYPDGFMISVATPSVQTPRWFHRDWPGLPSGRYSIRESRIQITLNVNLPDRLPDALRGAIPRTLHYAGVIGPGYLELRRDGHTEPKRYDFVKIGGSK
jgi:hypothetical protein